jgi:hypothetical protein
VADGGAGAGATAPDPAGVAGGTDDLTRLAQVWPAVLDTLRNNSSGPTASYFDGTRPLRLEQGRLTVGFPPGARFNRRNAEKPERREQLEAALVSVLGESLSLEYGELGADPESGGSPARQQRSAPVDEDAMVERVISEFNAEEVI